MAELIEYTPARLPTMTSPAFPDNTRKAIEFTPAVPAEEQKKSAATAKSTRKTPLMKQLILMMVLRRPKPKLK